MFGLNILIFAANWYNRGDEAAIRAMIDELKAKFPRAQFKIHFATMRVETLPYDDIEIIPSFANVQRRYILSRAKYALSIRSHGRYNLLPATKTRTKKENRLALDKFIEAVRWCDLALYAPGGPCIGDLYRQYTLLDCIDLIRYFQKPYIFYAPSMGPFRQYRHRIAECLKHADIVCLREAISAQFVEDLVPGLPVSVTLDSAFQHPIDEAVYSLQLDAYHSLKEFLQKYDRAIGITVTDLQWHSRYRGREFSDKIKNAFLGLIGTVRKRGYGVVFIPQLFGTQSDKTYMEEFSVSGCFVVDDTYDCYFQQYLISKLYAVVGMRYHSNIFSAKMGVPFLSVAYEQKMKGFAEKVGLSDYCISIDELTAENLTAYFDRLECNYDAYKQRLKQIGARGRQEAYQTTEQVVRLIENKGLYKK